MMVVKYGLQDNITRKVFYHLSDDFEEDSYDPIISRFETLHDKGIEQ